MRDSMKILIVSEYDRNISEWLFGYMKQYEYVVRETTDHYE